LLDLYHRQNAIAPYPSIIPQVASVRSVLPTEYSLSSMKQHSGTVSLLAQPMGFVLLLSQCYKYNYLFTYLNEKAHSSRNGQATG
jgi:hypothetical protein